MSGENEWNEKLFDCCGDCGTCCYGYWCTPCLFGSNAEKIDDSSCVGMCLVYCLLTECGLCFIPHLMKRQILREKYHLKEGPPCSDCPTTFFCSPCALCQEARELKSRENNAGVAYKVGSGPQPVVSQPTSGVKPQQPSKVRA